MMKKKNIQELNVKVVKIEKKKNYKNRWMEF